MNLSEENISGLVKMSLNDARRISIDLIKECSFKNGAKRVRLISDISKAKSSSEICRIMYYTLLAGEGLSVTNSGWQKQYA